MSKFIPHPIDTSKLQLSGELAELLEQLAKNTHEVWAAQRIADGWRYGPERNDKKKEHPCLISYDELPESEKQYDRATAGETLKVVLALGYEICRK